LFQKEKQSGRLSHAVSVCSFNWGTGDGCNPIQ
jgi:hypothetical protein